MSFTKLIPAAIRTHSMSILYAEILSTKIFLFSFLEPLELLEPLEQVPKTQQRADYPACAKDSSTFILIRSNGCEFSRYETVMSPKEVSCST